MFRGVRFSLSLKLSLKKRCLVKKRVDSLLGKHVAHNYIEVGSTPSQPMDGQSQLKVSSQTHYLVMSVRVLPLP